MPDKRDEFDNAWASSLKLGWGCLLGGVSSFGWCWLITWVTNFRGYQSLAATSGAGDNTPFIAGAIAIIPLLIMAYIFGQIDNA